MSLLCILPCHGICRHNFLCLPAHTFLCSFWHNCLCQHGHIFLCVTRIYYIVYFYFFVDTGSCFPPNTNTELYVLHGTSTKRLSHHVSWMNIQCTLHDSGCAYHAYDSLLLTIHSYHFHAIHLLLLLSSSLLLYWHPRHHVKTKQPWSNHKFECDRFESWKESNIEVRQLREQLKTILNDHPQHPLLYSCLQLLLSKKKQYMDFQMPPSLFREKKTLISHADTHARLRRVKYSAPKPD